MATRVALLETIRWQRPDGYFLLDRHLARMKRSAAFFRMPFREDGIRARLAEAEQAFSGHHQAALRVRLVVAGERVDVASASLPASPPGPQPVALAADPVDASDPLLQHKTTRRRLYEEAAASVPPGVEALLWNAHGNVTESTIANLVYTLGGRRYTPPLADGLLPGTFRQHLLDRGEIRVRSLPVADLPEVEGLYLVSALRGWRPASRAPA